MEKIKEEIAPDGKKVIHVKYTEDELAKMAENAKKFRDKFFKKS